MELPDNPLGVSTLDELIDWTTSYLHFKQAVEVVPLTPHLAEIYLGTFQDFRNRLTSDLQKQSILEARLPKSMREAIDAEKPNLVLIRGLLLG